LDNQFPNDLLLSIEKESASSTADICEADTISSKLDEQKLELDNNSERAIRLKMLITASDNANTIFTLVTDEEKLKIKWRKFFIVFFSILLVISILFVWVLIILNSKNILYVSTQILMGLFVYIIANIFSILYFMLKYINNNQYLEMFKTVTHKMLDFLSENKNTGD